MPVKAIFLLPTFILIAAGFAIYDNREQVLRLIDNSRRRIAVKLREIADDLQPQSEDVEIDELLRESRERRQRRGSRGSVGSRGSRRSEAGSVKAEGTGAEAKEVDGLRKRKPGAASGFEAVATSATTSASAPAVPVEDPMQSSFVSAASHASRESTATLPSDPAPAQAPEQSTALTTPPTAAPRARTPSPHHEPANPFESGYDTQHSESAFEGAAYWDVNEWVATNPHSRAASHSGDADRRGALTPNTETASVVSTPSMAGSDMDVDEVRSLPDERDAWSEVGSEVSEGSEGRR